MITSASMAAIFSKTPLILSYLFDRKTQEKIVGKIARRME